MLSGVILLSSVLYNLYSIKSKSLRRKVYPHETQYQTIRDWNALPDSLISSAEGAEDGVAKFTSLVRVVGNLRGQGPGE